MGDHARMPVLHQQKYDQRHHKLVRERRYLCTVADPGENPAIVLHPFWLWTLAPRTKKKLYLSNIGLLLKSIVMVIVILTYILQSGENDWLIVTKVMNEEI